MNNTIIITDSASDISLEDEQQYHIMVLPFNVVLGGKSMMSRIDFTNDEFYQMMADCDEVPMTAQITPFEFAKLYTDLYGKGYRHIILVLINSEGSATCGNASIAKGIFAEESPEAAKETDIHVIDGCSYTAAYGYPTVEAAKMLQAGKPVEEIVAYLTNWTQRSLIYAGLYSLKYAAKSGRIPSAAAFVGDAIGLKPIMRICDNHITTNDKVRGEKAIIPFIVKKTLENMIPGEPYTIIYGNDSDIRDELIRAMEQAVGYTHSGSYQIGAAIAANAGPRVVGTCFMRKE